MKMNGAAFMVLNNAGFNNNGNFSEGLSTVKFIGNADTTYSYLKGNSSTYFYNLSSNKTGYGTALKSMANVRNTLSVNGGNLYCDSNLTLLSDAGNTARVDVVPSTSEIFGKSMVQIYIPPRRAWRLMTAPVTSSNTIFNSWQNSGVYEAGKGMYVTGPNPTGESGNGLDASPQNNYSMKAFNYNTQAFTNVSNTKVAISSGANGSADNVGYFTFVRGDRVYANFNYNSGTCNVTTLTSIGRLQTHTQTFTTAKDSAKFSLIGNPFASPVDFNSITRNNLVKRMYVLDPTMGSVGVWVMLDDIDGDAIFTKSINTSSMSQYIQSNQAFFVVTNGNVSSASISFEETHKSSSYTNIMGRPAAPVIISSLRSKLYLEDPDTSIIADGALTEFNNLFSAATNLDDAGKIANTNENLGLVRKGLTFCVERRPMLTANDTIFLKLWKTTSRKYRLEFEPTLLVQTGLSGFLEDSYLQTTIPVSLSDATSYYFEVNADAASQAMDRFRIVFRAAAGPLPVSITHINAYVQNENIAVDWKVENEINISKYEIEKSADGISFALAGIKDAFNNNSEYTWIDVNPLKGFDYYRIKVYGKNGQIIYSTIVKVSLDDKIKHIGIFPNPVADGVINLVMNNMQSGFYELKLFDNIGQLIYKNDLQYKGNSGTYVLDFKKAKLSSGVYHLKIIRSDKTVSTLNVLIK